MQVYQTTYVMSFFFLFRFFPYTWPRIENNKSSWKNKCTMDGWRESLTKKKRNTQNETKTASYVLCIGHNNNKKNIIYLLLGLVRCFSYTIHSIFNNKKMLSTKEIQMHSSCSSLMTDDYCGCCGNDEVRLNVFIGYFCPSDLMLPISQQLNVLYFRFYQPWHQRLIIDIHNEMSIYQILLFL